MRLNRLLNSFIGTLILASPCVYAQETTGHSDWSNVRVHLSDSSRGKHRQVPAVIWFDPIEGTPATPFPAQGHYTLVQKDRMFSPHLLVVPAGSTVVFPNADPFFHNVFSLFDGKRFDLGLYEAGSSKEVVFSHEGLSYIFCNIHPEMSAVVLALSTPLYAVDDADGVFSVHNAPPGNYRMNVWIEGVSQSTLMRLSRRVHLSAGAVDLGDLPVSGIVHGTVAHANKFGKPYEQDPKPAY